MVALVQRFRRCETACDEFPYPERANFNDGHGPISIHVIFIALDRPKDVKRLDSLNCTSGYVNELRYIRRSSI